MTKAERNEVQDTESPILFDQKGKSSLLVSFGGIRAGLGIPVFEFFNSINDLDCDKLFIRDFDQMWYQKGLGETSTSIQGTAAFLKDYIDSNNYKKVIGLGNSMGGYASILYGTMLNWDKVVAFSPQTFIDRKNRILNLDFRWRSEMRKIHSNAEKQPEFFDLLEWAQTQNSQSDISIFYGPDHRLDRRHAERMEPIKNITLCPVNEGGGHGIVKTIRDKGDLRSIIENAINA